MWSYFFPSQCASLDWVCWTILSVHVSLGFGQCAVAECRYQLWTSCIVLHSVVDRLDISWAGDGSTDSVLFFCAFGRILLEGDRLASSGVWIIVNSHLKPRSSHFLYSKLRTVHTSRFKFVLVLYEGFFIA